MRAGWWMPTIATIAGEVAARSTRELGYDGLAQRSGAQTAEALVGRITGANEADARSLVTAGTMLTDTPAWLGEVAGLVSDGSTSRWVLRRRSGKDSATRRATSRPMIWWMPPTNWSEAATDLTPEQVGSARGICATSWIRPGSPIGRRPTGIAGSCG